ncbi:hypothetical protein V5799_000356 [Amblyomma americanum]|uniref:Uncharacterized protein n=1 Tax=Amblyomma americanum TaxID=6943 RepID=A0AAQ4D3A2_AMBAM
MQCQNEEAHSHWVLYSTKIRQLFPRNARGNLLAVVLQFLSNLLLMYHNNFLDFKTLRALIIPATSVEVTCAVSCMHTCSYNGGCDCN